MHNFHIYKYIAVLLIYTMTLASVAPAIAANKTLTVPEKYGSVTSRWDAGNHSDTVVIHIKDIHCNYAIQQNIKGILESLVTNNGVSLVGIEGAEGTVNTAVFQSLPDRESKETVCDKFLKKGVLTGAESLSISRGDTLKFDLWGVEDASAYLDNIETFRRVLSSQSVVGESLDQLEKTLDAVKISFFTPELYDFDTRSGQFQIGKLAMDVWASSLHGYIGALDIRPDSYPHFLLFSELIRLEKKVNPARVQSEVASLTGSVMNRMDSLNARRIRELAAQFNCGAVTADDYFSQLARVSDPEEYPTLHEYNRLLTIRPMVNTALLHEEISLIERIIRTKLIQSLIRMHGEKSTSDVESIDLCSEQLKVYRRLLTLSLTYEEFEQYAGQSVLADFQSLSDRIALLSSRYGDKTIPELSSDMKNVLSFADYFYRNAHARSEIMASNILSRMKETNLSSAVLISGGFHSNAVEKYLKKQNISYITITPSAKGVHEANEQYLSLMSNGEMFVSASPGADYVAFPVLCNEVVSNTEFFGRLRQFLARSLIEQKGMPIEAYRAQLRDDLSRRLFNQLLAIAGLDTQNIRRNTVNDVIANLSLDAVAELIMAYDNKLIDIDLTASGYDERSITPRDRELYAKYLLSFVDLTFQVNPSEQDIVSILLRLLASSKSEQKSSIHTAVWQYLNGLVASGQLSGDEQDTVLKTGVLSLTPYKMRVFAAKHIAYLAKQGDILLSGPVTPDNILILRSSDLLNISDGIWCECALLQENQPPRRFFIASRQSASRDREFFNAAKMLDIPITGSAVSNLPFARFQSFRVTDLDWSIDLMDALTGPEEFAELSGAVGILSAKLFMMNYPSSRIPVETVRIRSIDDELVAVPEITEDSAEQSTLQDAMDLYTRFFRLAISRGYSRQILTDGMELFAMSFITSAAAYISSIDETDLEVDGIDPASLGTMRRVASLYFGDIQKFVEEYIRALEADLIDSGDALKTGAHNAVSELERLGILQLPVIHRADNITIGKRQQDVFSTGELRYEATLETEDGVRSFFITALDDYTGVAQEEVAFSLLTVLGRSEYLSNKITQVPVSIEGYQKTSVSVTPAQMPADQFDPNTGNAEALAGKLGTAVAERYVLGLPSQGLNAYRIRLGSDNRPESVQVIDYNGLLSDRSGIEAFSTILAPVLELLENSADRGADTDTLLNITANYFSGLEAALLNMRARFSQDRKDISSIFDQLIPDQSGLILDRVLQFELSYVPLAQDVLRYINSLYGLDIQNVTARLKGIGVTVLNEIAGKNAITLPDNLSEEMVRIGRHNQASAVKISEDKRLSFEVIVPSVTLKGKSYILSTHSGADQAQEAVRALNALNRKTVTLFTSDIPFMNSEGFIVSEQAGDIYAADFDLESPYAQDFAYHLGSAMGEAFLLGIPDSTPGTIRISLDKGKPVAAVNSEPFDGIGHPVKYKSVIDAFVSEISQYPDLKEEEIRELIVVFFRGFYAALTSMQGYFASNRHELAGNRELSGNKNWQAVLRNLDPLQNDPAGILQYMVDQVNDMFFFDISLDRDFVITDQSTTALRMEELKSKCHAILKALPASFAVTVPDTLEPGDIAVLSHNLFMHNVIENIEAERISLRAEYPDGTRTDFLVKEAVQSDNPERCVRAYSLLGIESVSSTVVNVPAGSETYYSVTASENMTNLMKLPFNSVDIMETARLFGSALAEVYALGITTTSLDNFGFIVDEETAVQRIAPLDISRSFNKSMDEVAIAHLMAMFVEKAAVSGGFSQIRSISGAMLREFWSHLQELRTRYQDSAAGFEADPLFAGYMDSDMFLVRLNPSLVSVRDITQELLERLNGIISQKFDFEITTQDLVFTGSTISINGEEEAIADQEVNAEISQLARDVLSDMRDAGVIVIDDQSLESFIAIHSVNFSGEDGVPIISFRAVVYMHDGEIREFSISSAHPDNRSARIYELLKTFKQDTVPYYFSNREFEGYTGFHVIEEIGDLPLADYVPQSYTERMKVVKLLARASVASLIFNSINMGDKDLLVVFEDGDPARVIKTNINDLVSADKASKIQILEAFVSFATMHLDNGLPGHEVFLMVQNFFNEFSAGFREMQKLYQEHKDGVFASAVFNELPEWKGIEEKLALNESDMDTYVYGLQAFTNSLLRLTVVQEEDVRALGARLLNSMAADNSLVLDRELTADDIVIGKTNMYTSQMLEGYASLWFELKYQAVDGTMRTFFVKAHEPEDRSEEILLALEALNRKQYTFEIVKESLNRFNAFQVVQFIGNLDAQHFNANHPQAFVFARELGKAYAETHLLGIFDRRLENFRVIMKDNSPDSVVAIDFEDGLMSDEYQSRPLNYFIHYLTVSRQQGVSDQQLTEISIGFFSGFARALKQMQDYYMKNPAFLKSYPGLQGLTAWDAVLDRLNPGKYDIVDFVDRGINDVEKALNISIRNEINESVVFDMNSRDELHEYMKAFGFSAVERPSFSIDSKIYKNGNLGIILKTRPIMPIFVVKQIVRRLKYWAGNPGLIMKNAITFVMMFLQFTNGEEVAASRLGSSVAPMSLIRLQHGTLIDGKGPYKNFYFQEIMPVVVNTALEEYKANKDYEAINRMIDQYFDLQVYFWKKGAFDVDHSFIHNYAFADRNKRDMRLIDTGGLTTSKWLAKYLLRSKVGYNATIDFLAEEFPPECMEHYKKRHSEIFNTSTLEKVWNTELADPAEQIDMKWHKLFYASLPQQIFSKPVPAFTADQDLQDFIADQSFRDFSPGFTAVDMHLYANSDTSYFLKIWKSPVRRIGDRIKRFFKAAPDVVNTNLRFVLYSAARVSGVQLAAERLGRLVPPMLRFYQNPDGSFSFTKKPGSREAYVQKEVKYLIGDLFKEYRATANVSAANQLIDKLYDAQLAMWRRGVFDTDLAFWKNYGLDDPADPDLRLLDLSGLTSRKLAVFHVLFLKPNLDRIFRKLQEQLPPASFDYLRKRHAEVFTLTAFLRNWKTFDFQPAEQIRFSDRKYDSAGTVPEDQFGIAQQVYMQEYADKERFSDFTPEDSSVEAQVYLNKRKNVFLKTAHSKWRILNNILDKDGERESFLTLAKRTVIFILLSMNNTRGEVVAYARLGDYVPPMLPFTVERGLTLNFAAKKPVVTKGYYQKKMKYTAGKAIEIFLEQGRIDKINLLIDRYIELQFDLWRRGAFDRDISFWQNYGLNDLEALDLQLFDCGAVSDNRVMALAYVIYKFKRESYLKLIELELEKVLPPESIKYMMDRIREKFTLSNIVRLWGTEEPVQADSISIDVPQTGIPEPSYTISDDFDPDHDKWTPEMLHNVDTRVTMVNEFLDEAGIERDENIIFTILELMEYCKEFDDVNEIAEIIGSPITPLNVKQFMAISDTELYFTLTNLMFKMMNSEESIAAPGLFMVAVHTYLTHADAISVEHKPVLMPRINRLVEQSL
ncbi:MAG: hypothetical protein AB1454_06470 [Candidatus Auribacterota bacterium]